MTNPILLEALENEELPQFDTLEFPEPVPEFYIEFNHVKNCIEAAFPIRSPLGEYFESIAEEFGKVTKSAPNQYTLSRINPLYEDDALVEALRLAMTKAKDHLDAGNALMMLALVPEDKIKEAQDDIRADMLKSVKLATCIIGAVKNGYIERVDDDAEDDVPEEDASLSDED